MFKFEELRVYQDALRFVDRVYQETEKWPRNEKFGLIDQYRRAATSITLNIAEGSSRSKKDFCHFLDMSRGSCYESVAVLTIARNRGYILPEYYKTLYDLLESLSKQISSLKRSLL